MTPEEMRIAIAEHFGWKWYRVPNSEKFSRGPMRSLLLPIVHEYEGQAECWTVPADGSERICSMEYMARQGLIPNWPEDLNACHEMEKVLTGNLKTWWDYCSNLICVTPAVLGLNSHVHATAPQRCEAFLRTVGKWREDTGGMGSGDRSTELPPPTLKVIRIEK